MSEQDLATMSAGGGSVSGLCIEKLKGRDNYLLWKFNMRNLLIHDDLWCSIDGYPECDKSNPELKRRKNERALAKICLSVDASCVSHVMTAKTSKDAWLSLEKAYDDKGIGRRLKLLRMLCSVKLDDFGGNMDKYVGECLSLSQQLAAVSKPIDDEFLAAIILQGLPPKFDPMIMALESSVSDLTSDFVKAKLLQNTKWSDNCKGGDCLIADKSEKRSGKRRQEKKPRCWNCGKSGHVKKECTQKSVAMVATRFLADTWYVDSGASSHMTGRRDWIHDFSTSSVEVNVASGQTLKCVGIGNVCLKLRDYVLTLKEVMYIPGMSVNLLSVNSLAVKGLRVEFIESTCKIFRNKSCIANVRSVGGVYKLHTNAVALSSVNKEVSKESWHHRLGHLSYDSLKSLSHVIDFQNAEITNNCDVCILGKQIRFPFKKSGRDVAAKRLDLVHTDLCSIPLASHSGKRYILTFLDDHSRKVFLYFLKNKSEVASVTMDFVRLVENQCESKVKAIRSDNGTEYVNKELSSFFRQKGIVHQVTVPYSPQMNGAAERLNRTLLERVRCMLYHAGLDHKMWAEAANTAGYLINRSPSSRLGGKTPEEVWSGNRVKYDHLRIFGCEAFIHIHDVKRNKLQPKSKKYIFVGYEDNGRSYRLYDSETHNIKRSRDVKFNESVFPARKLGTGHGSPTIEIFLSGEEVDDSNSEWKSSVPESEVVGDAAREFVTEEPVTRNVEPVVSASGDDGGDDTLVFEDSVEEVVEPPEPRYNLRSRQPKGLYAHDAIPTEPRTVKEALGSGQSDLWQQAMQVEIDSFNQHEAWELVDRPMGKNVVRNKWIFKIKCDAEGKIARYKARLVAKGFTQKYGEDYFETFSPVVRYSSLRLLLAIAVDMELDIDHLDVQTAFLNGNLDEEIFMFQPEGFISPGGENKVYRLKKAVYGLKQASRAWYQRVKDVLLLTGFVQCQLEQCIFYKRNGKSVVYIALYVDDFIVCYNDARMAEELKESLRKPFKIKDLGAVRHVLGVTLERERTNKTLKLCQARYIERLLDSFGMSECKPVQTPLDPNIKFTDTSVLGEGNVPYRELIGSLMYLSVFTRPDITYAVSYLSQFNTCHTMEHWRAAKRVLRYLKGTQNVSLVFSRSGHVKIEGFVDADWGGDVRDRKSFSGFVFKYGGNTISWECRKQTCVSLSSTEAEYVALSEAAKEARCLRDLVTELTGSSGLIVGLFNDNQSAQKLSVNPVFHRRTKHIDIRYHYVREAVNNHVIKLNYLPTQEMVADVLTKSLCAPKHKFCVMNLRLGFS